MSIKLATSRVEGVSGVYRVAEYVTQVSISVKIVRDRVEFWCPYLKEWKPSFAIKFHDLIELTDKEKASL